MGDDDKRRGDRRDKKNRKKDDSDIIKNKKKDDDSKHDMPVVTPAPQPAFVPQPPQPQLVLEAGSYTVGTPVKYKGVFLTVLEVEGAGITLGGFEGNGNLVPQVNVPITEVQRYRSDFAITAKYIPEQGGVVVSTIMQLYSGGPFLTVVGVNADRISLIGKNYQGVLFSLSNYKRAAFRRFKVL